MGLQLTYRTSGMLSSKRKDWATPRQLFDMLHREFEFQLDVCATADTATCPLFFADHALDREWAPGPVWCNPPYGRDIWKWIRKGFNEAKRGAIVVMLLPARTDTSWWHDFCMKGEIRFLRGRLSFDDNRAGRCPFPSAVVIFRP